MTNSKTTLSVTLIGLLLGLTLMTGACAQDGEDEIAVDIGHLFLLNLEYAKWDMAFKKLSPRQQEFCGGSPNAMAENVISVFEARITRWDNESFDRDGDSARASFTVERDGLNPVGFGVYVERHGDQWLIETASAAGKDLCSSKS